MDGHLIVKLTNLEEEQIKILEADNEESKTMMKVVKEKKGDSESLQDFIKENYGMNLEPEDEPNTIVFIDKSEEETKGDKFVFKIDFETFNVNGTNQEIAEPFVGSRGSKLDVKFLLKAVLFSCLFYLLAHNDSKKFVVNLIKIRKANYLYVGMALFFVIYLCLNLIV